MKHLLSLLIITLLAVNAFAEDRVYINVGQATVKRSLLAFPPLLQWGAITGKSITNTGQELYATISNDLNTSALFTTILPNAYLEDVKTVGIKPAPQEANGFQFSKWKAIDTEFLIRGGYKVINSQITFEVYVYYVPQAKLVFGKIYKGSQDQVRTIAHNFSDDMVEALTGKKSMFNTKIVASVDQGIRSHKEIYTFDWDGHNKQKITSHKSIAISPAWSHDGNKIAYTAYVMHTPEGKTKSRNADLFLYELKTKKRWLISYRKGINSGAAFLNDGENILLTLSNGARPDIYKMSVDGKNINRITNGPNGAMNVEPAVSPDGSKIAFSSSRSGKIMLYVMNANGSDIKRITFAGRYNSTPTWSPDGDLIAFAGLDDKKGAFDIFVIDPNGMKLKRLTSAAKQSGKWANNEDPTFSPDGRHIMFVSDRSGKKQLYIVGPDGNNERRITYDNNNYSKPKWSPFL